MHTHYLSHSIPFEGYCLSAKDLDEEMDKPNYSKQGRGYYKVRGGVIKIVKRHEGFHYLQHNFLQMDLRRMLHCYRQNIQLKIVY